jgi:NOL1/NOP2/fmu family ribosome biogenesis protein
MKIQILDKTKKRKFLSGLAEFGLKKVSELLVRSGKERVRAFSGSLSREEIMEIWRLFPIEGIGLYVGKEFVNRNGTREVRLSVDGMHVWKEQLIKKVFVLSKEQEKDWFEGKDVEISEGQNDYEGFVLVKSADGKDFVGMGKIGGEGKILFGYLPKERRRRSNVV